MLKFTETQQQARGILESDATHILLEGGSRSGKTFLLVRQVVTRALKAPGSRHAILRFRLNHLMASIVMDTFPAVMRKAFEGVTWTLNKKELFAELPGGSQIMFGGLDDKERTEKILGQEYATIYLNEISQIPYSSRNLAITRLAQKAEQRLNDKPSGELKPRVYYDCNPPTKAHWAYRLFHEHVDPETKRLIPFPERYRWFGMNPEGNAANLSAEYLGTLEGMSERLKRRFLFGEWSDATPNALFPDDVIDKWRVDDGKVPDLVRVVVAVDPSGAGEGEGVHDAIGIVVAGVGTDGNAYVLEDCTVTASPSVWGRVVASAYDRHAADCVVAEENFGGAMVRMVIQAARAGTPYKAVSASRGKAVRAEPISALYEQGKVRHAGRFVELEDELAAFSTTGYLGETSPNRADALVWAISELFRGIVKPAKPKPVMRSMIHVQPSPTAWMA